MFAGGLFCCGLIAGAFAGTLGRKGTGLGFAWTLPGQLTLKGRGRGAVVHSQGWPGVVT